jgi:hypothetical protein
MILRLIITIVLSFCALSYLLNIYATVKFRNHELIKPAREADPASYWLGITMFIVLAPFFVADTCLEGLTGFSFFKDKS